ncbi:hypothetical protein FQN50_001692 [Emmonsiellopsis sp. PD_5]|nr:hypothetical protein FQN50_001692 [Emmonsiellopsis sp. PD_5]
MSPSITQPRSPLSFLDLPPEIRLQIYRLSLSWPNLRRPFARLRIECEQDEASWFTYHPPSSPQYIMGNIPCFFTPKCTLPPPRIPESDYVTPNLFLLNHQITYEALPVLHSQELVIDEPPPYSIALGRPVDITMFICEGALQKARRVTLKIDITSLASRWARTVDTLLDVWCVGNCLEELRIVLTGEFSMYRANILGEEGSRLILFKMFGKLRNFGDRNISGINLSIEGLDPFPVPVKRDPSPGRWYFGP